MDEPRPTLTASSSRSDEVDAFQFRRANPDGKVLKNLLENEALGTKKNSPKIMSHITTAKMFCQDMNIDNEDISEIYFRLNRMRQEQNIFRKSSGPNFLEPIMAKPKTRIPDINDEAIDPNDHIDFEEEGADLDEEDITSAVEQNPTLESQRGTLTAGTCNTIDAEFESFDYTETSSALRYRSGIGKTAMGILRVDFNRWPISFSIGVVTALVALFIQTSIEHLTNFKYNILSTWFQKTYEEKDPYLSYMMSVGFNMLCCFLATLCCVIAPEAVGSGIPQIKSYLNGVNIPRLMRFKTLLGKTIGVIMSVTGGLPVGKEGPMIHSGAVVGAGLSQGKATSLPITTKYNRVYRTDSEKRDFVACGAAAGVAAAFGAPLGGLLFAIEEGASHINHSTLWRIAMSSITSYFTLNIISSVIKGIPGQMSNGGLISFGEFDDASYNFYQLLIFAFMGIVGGISGAVFNGLNEKLTKFRVRKMNSKITKVFEAISCGIAAATLAFAMMQLIDDCRAYDVDINDAPVRLYCQDGKASAAASLWYKTPEETVRSLFHDKPGAHSFSTLLIFTILYYLLACWTYGMFISSGLFVPSILIGAAWGRLLGMCLFFVLPHWNWGDLGKYALIGASAQLAGTVRLTYSLTAIILEATGNLTYIFPVFVTVFISKIVGDFLNEGLYEIHINILGIPLLPYQPKVELRTVTAKDMMNTKVKCFKIRSKVHEVVKVLQNCTHNAFPIVDTDCKMNITDGTINTYGRMRGLMKRHDIVTMLYHGIFTENNRFGKETYEMLREKYPRFMQLEEFVIPEEHLDYTIDFSNAMDSAPYLANMTMSMPAVYSLFRNMGMRHIVVVNLDNEIVGIITRKEIAALEPEFTPFPKSKITLYKKTSIVNHRRSIKIGNEAQLRRRNRTTSYNRFK